MIAGGQFLAGGTVAGETFTPEDFTEEHQMIAEVTAQFVEEEVVPRIGEIESKDWSVTTRLLRRCGELGLLGVEVPVEYGGVGLDKVSAMIVSQKLARVSSFYVSHGGTSGIGALPIVYFGSEEQKTKYLPGICTGQTISAYALSEAGSGSDALAAKSSSTLSADGSSWTLNGEKMWITNAAFADVFIVFAQAHGKDFTCFIVEKTAPGVSTGGEEHKMGLRGSSTRALILDGVRIPAGNLLGEVGKGHHVAFNILNIGRAKIAAGAAGGSITALNDAIVYAKQRVAFGRPIASFGAIQHKLAEMAIRTWATEGMVYRTAAAMDAAIGEAGGKGPGSILKAIEEFAIECSILKVFGTEALDYVVDEAVQIYGGYGYSEEYPVERYYRDSRVNRIFEGTNEINRMIVPTLLLKRLAAGSIRFDAAERDATVVERARAVFQWLLRLASEKFGPALRNEQETLMLLSDIAIDIYAMDTAAVRTERPGRSQIVADIAAVLTSDARDRIEISGRRLLARLASAAQLHDLTRELQTRLADSPCDGIQCRRRIAEFLLDTGKYAY